MTKAESHYVFEHVGHYGRPEGDIAATHKVVVRPSGFRSNALLENTAWALVGIFETRTEASEYAASYRSFLAIEEAWSFGAKS